MTYFNVEQGRGFAAPLFCPFPLLIQLTMCPDLVESDRIHGP